MGAVDGKDQVRLSRPGQRRVTSDARATAQRTAASAPDDDGRLGVGHGIVAAYDGEVGAFPDDRDPGLREAVAPALEPRCDECGPRRVGQEESDVRAAEAQLRISS